MRGISARFSEIFRDNLQNTGRRPFIHNNRMMTSADRSRTAPDKMRASADGSRTAPDRTHDIFILAVRPFVSDTEVLGR